ncbi:MAG: hypothetical protein ACFE9C_17450, partial [Candidatus Hodarchaeota archaeon]
MRKKLFVLLTVFIFINVASCPVIFYAKGETTNSLQEILDSRAGGDLEGIDGTPRFAAYFLEGAKRDTGNDWIVPVSDDYYEVSYKQTFECVLP